MEKIEVGRSYVPVPNEYLQDDDAWRHINEYIMHHCHENNAIRLEGPPELKEDFTRFARDQHLLVFPIGRVIDQKWMLTFNDWY